jgi:outer membrane protein OmpA-like peptidoglycan-associated protein
LTYSWNASGGKVNGTGANVQLDTAGAPAGPITVNGTVSDDRGLTASCSSQVNVEVPPPPPTASKLNEINFPDKKKPARVDNAAKAILDDVALKLQRDADAKAVVIGFADADELKKKTNKNLAAERAYNTKQYLTAEKGIDPARIEVRTGTGEGQKAEIWVVPAGATYTGEGTTVVDESMFAKKVTKKPMAKKKPAAQ